MKALKWFGAGLAGGMIGAVIWALVYHYVDFEVGWIAWGIGLLAGLGVRATAQDTAGDGPGFVAIAAAVIALCVGKFGGVYLDVREGYSADTPEDREYLTTFVADQVILERRHSGEPFDTRVINPELPPGSQDYDPTVWREARRRFNEFTPSQLKKFANDPSLLIPEEYLTTFVADVVMNEWEEEGREVRWPPGVEPYTGVWSGDYPEAAWAEAEERWNAMSERQRAALRHEILPKPDTGLAAAWRFFPHTFTLLDLIWFGLAFFTAYKLGASDIED